MTRWGAGGGRRHGAASYTRERTCPELIVDMKLYGITNCDTVKRARAWLGERGIAYDWVDFRRIPPDDALLSRWSREVGWERLVNRRGTTWRKLDADEQAGVRDERSAVAAMRKHPTLIKRPVIEHDDALIVGFEPDEYAERFASPAADRPAGRGR